MNNIYVYLKKTVYRYLLLVAFVGFSFAGLAKVKLPSMLSENAIFQQNSDILLYGSADGSKMVRIYTSWDRKTHTVRADSAGKFSKSVKTPRGGGPFYISFNDGEETRLNNIMMGEVWFCSGQSNMAMLMKGKEPIMNAEELMANSTNSQIRIFTAGRRVADSPQQDIHGHWAEATPETVAKSSALAYQFAQKLQARLNVPVGVIVSSWGGTPIRAWMSDESLKGIVDTVALVAGKPAQNPSTLFNGMVSPFLNYVIRGFLWYQGENDRLRAEQYREMMPAMVRDWRQKFKNKDLPFYYVQIAPWRYPVDKELGAPFFREMQYDLSKTISNTGIVVTSDIGSNKTIHPPDKTAIADRLLNMALAKTYGFKTAQYLGPEPQSMGVKKDVAYITFNHAKSGLLVKASDTDNFEVAGADGIFYPAVFKVTDRGLEVWSHEVASPEMVRYGFKNYFQGNLFNREGLPASTFSINR